MLFPDAFGPVIRATAGSAPPMLTSFGIALRGKKMQVCIIHLHIT